MVKYLLLLILLSACSTTSRINWNLRQAEKHLKRAEMLGGKVHSDTVFVTKTVIVPEVRVDTLIKQVDFRDTITFYKDKFHVKVKVDTLLKSIHIEGKCESDTVKIEVPVTVTKEIKSGWPWWWLLVAAMAGAGLVSIFRKR